MAADVIGLGALAVEAAPAWLVTGIVAAFLVGFPLFWCAVVWFLSLAGGWQRLARDYAAGGRAVSGQRRSRVLGMVGWVSYRFVLTVHVADDGVFIEVMPLFRPGHPRLFIPWGAFSGRRPTGILMWKAERFDVGSPVIATLTLPAGLIPPGRGA